MFPLVHPSSLPAFLHRHTLRPCTRTSTAAESPLPPFPFSPSNHRNRSSRNFVLPPPMPFRLLSLRWLCWRFQEPLRLHPSPTPASPLPTPPPAYAPSFPAGHHHNSLSRPLPPSLLLPLPGYLSGAPKACLFSPISLPPHLPTCCDNAPTPPCLGLIAPGQGITSPSIWIQWTKRTSKMWLRWW